MESPGKYDSSCRNQGTLEDQGVFSDQNDDDTEEYKPQQVDFLDDSPDISPVRAKIEMGERKTVSNPLLTPVINLERVDSNEQGVLELQKPIFPLGPNLDLGGTDISNVQIQLEVNSAERGQVVEGDQIQPTEEQMSSHGAEEDDVTDVHREQRREQSPGSDSQQGRKRAHEEDGVSK